MAIHVHVHVSKVILFVFLENGNVVMSPFQLFYYILYSLSGSCRQIGHTYSHILTFLMSI